MYHSYMKFAALSLLSCFAYGISFSDNFNDNDISDWENRMYTASWSTQNGMVLGSISGSPGALAPIAEYMLMNCSVTSSCTGAHAFGVMARLTEDNSAIVAYVSPDANVARIRQVIQGELSTSLASIAVDFPSGVFYNLTLTCEEDDLTFLIEVPSTGDSWSFTATDPDPQSGSFGLHMGDESLALWDWIEVEGFADGEAVLSWLITDDQAVGDGDFCLEPSETIALSMEITNTSDSPLINVFGILQSLNSELQVTENFVDYGDIPGLSSTYGNGSFSVFAPLVTPEDEVYGMRLTVMADGGYQEQIYFSLPVGSGVATDLESDSFGWSAAPVSPGWENDWHVSTTRNHTPGGQYSFKCGATDSGDYSDHHYGYLETPYFNIPLNGECTFWSWLDAQQISSSVALDGGMVQYRRLDEWIDLFPVPPYTHEISSGSTGPFPAGTQLYSGIVDWTAYSILFPENLAGPGALRFVFGSDNSGSREGWYIDDFLVTGPGSSSENSTEPVQQPFLSVSDNPFAGAVTFSFMIPGSADSSIEIRDITGRVIQEIPAAGQAVSSVMWNAEAVPSGIYFARISGTDMKPLKLVRL